MGSLGYVAEVTRRSTTLCEVLAGTEVASLADILDLVDLAAGRCAYRYVGQAVVTASIQDMIMLHGFRKGSLVRVRANVLATGDASILLQIQVHVDNVNTRAYTLCATCNATFVAVDPRTGRPANVVKPLEAESEEATSFIEEGKNKKRELQRTRNSFLEFEKCQDSSELCHLATKPAKGHREVLHIHDATITVHKQYLPRHKNFSGMVFGGDLLETMERVASYCARRVIRGKGEVRCIAIKYFTFKQPIAPMNLWMLTARACLIVGSVIIVEVSATIDKNHDGTTIVPANDGLFAILCTQDADGTLPAEIDVELDASNASLECLRARAKAKLWSESESFDSSVLNIAE